MIAGVVEFPGATCIFVKDFVDVFEGLFEHCSIFPLFGNACI
jgi:hypothetical protein